MYLLEEKRIHFPPISFGLKSIRVIYNVTERKDRREEEQEEKGKAGGKEEVGNVEDSFKGAWQREERHAVTSALISRTSGKTILAR